MAPVTFSVSEVRVAATCPRISYFDAEHTRRNGLKTRSVTRLWKAGDDETACGSLFHNAVEAFNRRALDAPEVRAALEGDPDPRAIERGSARTSTATASTSTPWPRSPPAQQQAFIRAVEIYMGELADIVGDALARGKPAGEVLDQLFGDRRRRVDVTFQVGPERRAGARHRHPRLRLLRLADRAPPDHRLQADAGRRAEQRPVPGRALRPDAQRPAPDRARRRRALPAPRAADGRAVLGAGPRPAAQALRPAGVDGRVGPLRRGERAGPEAARRAVVLPALQVGQGRPVRSTGSAPSTRAAGCTHWTDAATGTSASAAAEPRGRRPRAATARPAPGRRRSRPHAREDATGRLGRRSLRRGRLAPDRDDRRRRLARWGCRCRPCRRTSPSSGRPAAARPGWPRSWPRRPSASASRSWPSTRRATSSSSSARRPSRPASPPERPELRRDFLDRVEPRVWTPGSSHGRRLSLDPIRLAGRDELARIADPDRREEEWEGMLAVAAAQLVGLAKVGGETDSQQTFLFQVLRSPGGRRPAAGTWTWPRSPPRPPTPTTVGLDDPDQFIKKSEREKLARKLNGLRLGPAASLFTGGQPARPRRDVPARRPRQDAPERRLPERPGRRRPEALLRGRPGRRGLPLDGHLARRRSRAGPACSSTSTRPATSSRPGPPSRRPRGR